MTKEGTVLSKNKTNKRCVSGGCPKLTFNEKQQNGAEAKPNGVL